MTSQLAPTSSGRIVTPLMRLQDQAHTKVMLVTLPETTPVSEAASLQDDLRRAGIEPYGWIINKSLAFSGTRSYGFGSKRSERRLLAFRTGSQSEPSSSVGERSPPSA